MSTRFEDVSVEERLRDAARAYTGAIEPEPDAWLRLRTSIDDRQVLPRYRRSRVVTIAFAAAVVVALVVAAAIVMNRVSTTKSSAPPATKPYFPGPDVSVDHQLLVSPSTGLRDGQSIRLSGRHFAVGVGHGGGVSAIQVATCRAGATPANWGEQCDQRTSAGTAASDVRSRTPLRKAKLHQPARANCCVDMTGYRYSAARHLNLPGGAVDCAFESCIVLAVGFDRGYGVAPLHFDPNAASLPTPRLSVSPNTDLQEGRQVTLHIEDAWPGGRDRRGATAALCAVRGTTPICDQTDLDIGGVSPIDIHGSAALTMTVKSTVLSSGCCTAGDAAGVADCTEAPGCVIGVEVPAGPLGGQNSQVVVPITFSAAVGARPLADRLPHATIDPPGPYTDGQQGTITATGVPKGTAIGQCGTMPDADPMYLECAPGGVTATNKITLHRFIDEPIPNATHSKRIDCAQPGRCALYLYNTPGEQPVPTFRYLEFAPLTVN